MSGRGQTDGAIRDAPDDCLAWWPDSGLGGVVMRRRAIQTMGFTFGMTVTVKDAAGNVVPSPPLPTAMAHDVFRYVRHVPYLRRSIRFIPELVSRLRVPAERHSASAAGIEAQVVRSETR